MIHISLVVCSDSLSLRRHDAPNVHISLCHGWGRGLLGPHSSHRPRNDRGISKNSWTRSRLDLGLSQSLVSSLIFVSKKVKYPRNSSIFPRNDQGMRKKSSPRSRLDLGLGQGSRLLLDLGLEKGALGDLWCILSLSDTSNQKYVVAPLQRFHSSD